MAFARVYNNYLPELVSRTFPSTNRNNAYLSSQGNRVGVNYCPGSMSRVCVEKIELLSPYLSLPFKT